MKDIKSLSHKELLKEYDDCMKDWSKFSCDCFGFYISALHSAIVQKGGWPPKIKTPHQ